MQEPPGYRPRGYGICIIEAMDWKSRGNYSEIVDCVISRMQLEHLKKREEKGNLYRSDLTQYAEAIAGVIAREDCVGEEARGLL